MRLFTSIETIVASFLAATCLIAAEPSLAAQKTKPAAAAKIDPAALRAAKAMGAYLRSLRTFEVTSSAILQQVVDDKGQKVETTVTATYKVRRPDGFVVDLVTEKKARRYIYDGKAFTVFAPKVGYFASVSAPATIGATVEMIYDQYGVVLPLADLFYWGEKASPADRLTSARSLGPAKIDGVDTDHYAFAGPDLDWQVWIERGGRPLPRKMLITTIDDPARPTFTANLTWSLAPRFAADTFTFTPAADAKPIAMARVDQ